MAEVVPAVWAGPAAVLGAVLLGTIALAGASLDGVLAARRAGVAGGAVAPVAEVARLLRQRRSSTVAADVPLWRTGGAGLLVAALLMVAVVPLGPWVLADLPVGVVWFNAVDVLVWAFVWLAGWGPNSAYALVGGYRFLATAMAYELPLMFALVTPAVAAGSLRVADVAAAQQGVWFAASMPVAFAGYLVGVAGFSVWGPLSAPAGADLAGGVLGESSGVDRLLLQAGRWALLAAGAAFAVPLFLGGGAGPLLPGWLWVPVKALLLLAALVWVRRLLPALRPDRFLEIGWLVLLPAVLVQLMVVAVVTAVRG